MDVYNPWQYTNSSFGSVNVQSLITINAGYKGWLEMAIPRRYMAAFTHTSLFEVRMSIECVSRLKPHKIPTEKRPTSSETILSPTYFRGTAKMFNCEISRQVWLLG